MNIQEYLDILRNHDYHYFVLGESLVSDTEYDQLRTEFNEKFPDHPYTRQVGHKVSKYQEIDLPFVMGGLNKVGIASVQTWIQRIKVEDFVASEKLDGNSITVTWRNGIPIFAASRGDSYTGANILSKAAHFLPKIPIKNEVTLRGEVLILGEDHKIFGYKNRRNAVTGLLRRDDINPEDLKHLAVIWYELINIKDHSTTDQLDSEIKRLDFIHNVLELPIVRYTSITSLSIPGVFAIGNILANELLEFKSTAPYDIDGLVLTRNDSKFENAEYPENKVKFKVNEEAKRATVTGIEWSITRTGLVRPVVLIEPIDILGVTVSRVTGFNWNYLNQNRIGRGAEIGVVRSGDVIPYITEVFEGVPAKRPLLCPACQTPVVYFKNVDLCCPNEHCIGKQKYRIAHFFEVLGAENITDRTVEMLGVHNIQDMYELTLHGITGRAGLGDSKARTILNEIRKTLHTKPEKLLQAFGIHMIGEETSKTICQRVSLDDLFYENPSALSLGIGDAAFSSLMKHIGQFLPLYVFLKQKGLVLEEKTNGNLTGKVFALTGNGPLKRKVYIDAIEKKGGSVKNSVNKNTNFLVTDDLSTNSTKIQNARKFGTRVISYDELGYMLKEE